MRRVNSANTRKRRNEYKERYLKRKKKEEKERIKERKIRKL